MFLPLEWLIVMDVLLSTEAISGPSPWRTDPAFTHTSMITLPLGAVMTIDDPVPER